MLLTRKSSSTGSSHSSSSLVGRLHRGLSQALPTLDRRGFLRRSGVGVGVGLAASQLSLVKKSHAMGSAPSGAESKIEVKRTVCTHCSVGCAVDAVVQNGVWVRQEPVFDSPINLGAHCAKGAALREHGHGEYRLRYPMKLVNGKYERISWDTALTEISAKMLELRKSSGPDSVYFIGSSKHNNEQAYLLRKFVSYWGTNNCDHQARICHSTTVAGVANTWGYGAMTNSYNDMQNSKVAMYIGSNAAEAHPVSMLHMLHAKENGCKMIVVDPRFTRTAARADEFVRIRSGADIPFLFGLLYHIFKNGWEDKKYINDRVFGMEKVKEEVLAKWKPEAVEEACGVKEEQMLRVAKMLHDHNPGTIVWCMGQTQHTTGNAVVRASCILQLALGNVGKTGGGTNIFRGHDNVQGATDVGPNPDSLPGYYGIAEGSWKHFAKAWGVDFEWIKGRFSSPAMMTKPGITVSRWIDGVLEKNELIDQDSNLKGVFYWGHAPNSQTRGLEMKRAMDKLDLLVVVDPYPSATASMAAMPGDAKDLNPNRAVYLLPAATQFETSGSCTASNRSIQWREKVIEPLWESRSDHMIMYQLADKLGFGPELVKNYKLQKVKGQDEPVVEDILREINRSVWTIGYTGHSPERLKAHMRNMHLFDVKTLKCKGGKDAETGYDLTGDYFGLPWPGQSEVVTGEVIPGLGIFAALALEGLDVKEMHVAHMRFQALGAVTGIANGPDRAVDFSQDVFHHRLVLPFDFLQLVVFHQLWAKAQLVGQLVHDHVIGAAFPQGLDHFFAPLDRAVGRRAGAAGFKLGGSRQEVDRPVGVEVFRVTGHGGHGGSGRRIGIHHHQQVQLVHGTLHFQATGLGVGRVAPIEHALEVAVLIDQLVFLEHTIDPARHRDTGFGHHGRRGEATFDPLEVHAPGFGKVFP